jgi:dolichol-phosphate mannosyltransferase
MKKNNNLKQPILITGATGFIGANLVRYFVSKNIKVNIILKKNSNIWRIKNIINKTNFFYVDLNDEKKLNQKVKLIKPKTIFHLAANGAYSYQTDLNSIKNSILDGTINLINACKKYNFKIFINTGSSSEYGFKKKKMKEKDILVPNSYYSTFKSSATLFCQFESLKSNLPIITVRPFHVYGPYERSNRLIPSLIKNMLSDKKVKLVSPKVSRDMIYISDVVNFYIMVANKKNLKGEIFNLGSGKKTTIKEIYNLLKKITNYKVKNYWGSMKNRYWDQSIWYSNNSYVKTKLNWKPEVSLKKGLANTVNWYKKFYNE